MNNTNASGSRPPEMQLTLDRRETRLSHVLLDFPHTLADLPVGDVLCEYLDGRQTWVAERKTVDDLASSIKSGRWAEQTSRLYQSGYDRIFFILVGDLRSTRHFPYDSLLGAIVNAELRPRSYVLRSFDLSETAAIVLTLCKKAGCPSTGVPSGLRPPITPTSKRKRDADASTVWSRQLMCIPSISEKIAKALLAHFGTLPALTAALGEPLKTFPRVRLDERACLGKKRIELLAKYLRATGEA
jgi:ERCC4-type nuclease